MPKPRKDLVVCLKNAGYEASLEIRKIYVALSDAAALEQNLLRVIDESGGDYLFPATFFKRLDVSPGTRRALLAAS